MKQWIGLIAVLGVVNGAADASEISGELEIPIGERGVEAVLQDALAEIRSVCKFRAGTSPYLERLQTGPILSAVEDGLMLRYVCLVETDPRLNEPGRDGRRTDAGKGLLEQQPLVKRRGPFGWDMTYANAFDSAGVPRNDTMRKLFRDSWLQAHYVRSFPDPALFEALASADTAVLIDYELRLPIYGGRKLVVFAATSNTAQILYTGRGGRIETRSADASALRAFARAMLTHQPLAPSSPPQPYTAPGVAPGAFVDSGYLGVVSVSIDGQSRQFAIIKEEMSARDNDARADAAPTVADAALPLMR